MKFRLTTLSLITLFSFVLMQAGALLRASVDEGEMEITRLRNEFLGKDPKFINEKIGVPENTAAKDTWNYKMPIGDNQVSEITGFTVKFVDEKVSALEAVRDLKWVVFKGKRLASLPANVGKNAPQSKILEGCKFQKSVEKLTQDESMFLLGNLRESLIAARVNKHMCFVNEKCDYAKLLKKFIANKVAWVTEAREGETVANISLYEGFILTILNDERNKK